MNSKRPKVEAIRQPTLFQMEKLEKAAAELTGKLEVDRPYHEPGLLLGTSAFTAVGWPGTFYPEGMKPAQYLSFYATQFKTVEVDSTFYGTPSAATVSNWYQKTPPDFIFAAKMPQVVTHEKVLVDCEAEFDEFIERMGLLNEKLGPLVLQFPHFISNSMSRDEFLSRLRFFLKRIQDKKTCRFVVEIRNKNWLDARLADLLREFNVALALTDTSFMPRPWEMRDSLDLVTADFAYVRWLGDRKGIEARTTTWEKVIVDRTSELKDWTQVLKQMINNSKIRKIFAYANNHYQGFGPGTVKLFWDLWNQK